MERCGSGKRCGSDFLEVTVDYKKTTGKLRYFLTFFEKYIQTWWMHTSFSVCLWKAHMGAN